MALWVAMETKWSFLHYYSLRRKNQNYGRQAYGDIFLLRYISIRVITAVRIFYAVITVMAIVTEESLTWSYGFG